MESRWSSYGSLHWTTTTAQFSKAGFMTIGGFNFEDEVRRVARQLWPESKFSGAAMIDSRERDGVFETEWVIHIIEATTQRSKAKAAEDVEKLVKLKRKLQSRNKPIQPWFVTESEPTADQRAVAPKDGSVRVLSFEQFRAQLVDAHEYLRDRANYAFGSARDPETGKFVVADAYVPVELMSTDGDSLSTSDLGEAVAAGSRIVVLGDYGAGKSMALREAHRGLADRFRNSRSFAFPLHINLRDHHGQIEPAEAIERHARLIGMPDPAQLVRGWRAGYTHLLLDGFDEMATPGWAGVPSKMRETRRRSVELIRRTVKDHPDGAGILVAGRENYFDNLSELTESLGTIGFKVYRVGEFSEAQIDAFLNTRGWTSGLPEWLPARPLLLAYLAGRGLLADALNVANSAAPSMAWDQLLELVCKREADIEANISPETLRLVIERLASVARSRGDGLGPINFSDIDSVFREVSGSPPDDRAIVLLQRLPGLGPADAESGARRFIDADLADTARAGDVVQNALNPYQPQGEPESWIASLGNLGVGVAHYQGERQGLDPAKVAFALRKVAENGSRSALTADLVRVAVDFGATVADLAIVSVRNASFETLRLDEDCGNLNDLEFRSCLFLELDFPRDGLDVARMPRFIDCQFGRVEGRVSERDLPQERFVDCSFESFSEATTTTSAAMGTSLPMSQRVALSVLKKLFVQRGSGRKGGCLLYTSPSPRD